jgi:hypothetical protein
VEIAEHFLGPQIDAALSGIAVRQLDDGDALGPEKQQQGDQPQPHGHTAVRGDGGHDV